jgi:hypothetical protein
MKYIIEIDETEIREVLSRYIAEKTGVKFAADKVPIEVKSKQNYKSEWEAATIRVRFSENA